MILQKFNKIIASLAISGLVLFMASPALASVDYDPNDPYFDPSGTYVPPAPPVVTPVPVVEETQAITDDTAVLPESSTPEIVGEEIVSREAAEEIVGTSPAVVDAGVEAELIAGNSETGPDSSNDSSITHDSAQDTDVNNDAAVTNNVNASAGTGDNQSSQNTGDGSIETGDSDLVANIITAANSVISGASSMALPIINYFGDLIGDLSFEGGGENVANLLAGQSINDIVSNSITGPGSINTAEISENNNSDTDINNDGQIDNELRLSSSTGNNDASKNTGDGTIETGDANIASNVVNFLNNTILASNWWMGMINIFGDWTGNLLLPSFAGVGAGAGSVDLASGNSVTGPGSTNIASTNLSNSSDLEIDNDADIIDAVDINANTGSNESIGNTGDGMIQTGDVNVDNNQLTVANNTVIGGNWWMLLVNTLDGWTGAIIGSPDGSTSFIPSFLFGSSATNVATGPDSINIAEVDVTNEQDTEITNDADVNNHLTLDANTGGNTANFNTGSGMVQTGDANVMSNLVNFVNNTFNVDNWLFGVVNVFGTWDGSAQFGDVATDGAGILGGQDLSVAAINEQTGPGSDNLAEVISEEETELKINNDLSLKSDTRIKGNTGDNRADWNTGVGSIETGDINADGTMGVFGNITDIELPAGEGESDILASNMETGPGSENNAFVKIINKMKIAVNNAADVCKDVIMDLNAGSNFAEGNTSGGFIKTGDISVKFREKEVLNVVNIVQGAVCEEGVCEEEVVVPEQEVVVAPEMGAGQEVAPAAEVQPEVFPMGEVLPAAGQAILWPLLAAIAIFAVAKKRRFLAEKINRAIKR